MYSTNLSLTWFAGLDYTAAESVDFIFDSTSTPPQPAPIVINDDAIVERQVETILLRAVVIEESIPSIVVSPNSQISISDNDRELQCVEDG